jgi:hypothetical protein
MAPLDMMLWVDTLRNWIVISRVIHARKATDPPLLIAGAQSSGLFVWRIRSLRVLF